MREPVRARSTETRAKRPKLYAETIPAGTNIYQFLIDPNSKNGITMIGTIDREWQVYPSSIPRVETKKHLAERTVSRSPEDKFKREIISYC